ncbi:MAG: GNAT family protein [Liquorilactobacillus ghanensis]|uniref:GNAT family N-acetyltransferase n=1 Tax=Liquorilactobacillus ghanensis TaxID=399370 RepID=UPI0039E8649C
MFTYAEFTLGNDQIKLTLPDKGQATDLFQAIEHDRQELERWMPWTKTTNSIKDEENFINYAREQVIQNKLLELVIVINKTAAGMADLHNIDWGNRRAEVGYWLSSDFQGRGIMTETVKRLIKTAFADWSLHKVIIQADSENLASQAVARRLGFSKEAVLKEQLYSGKEFHDLVVYTQLLNDWSK